MAAEASLLGYRCTMVSSLRVKVGCRGAVAIRPLSHRKGNYQGDLATSQKTEPGSICISASAHEQVRGKVDAHFADLGEQQLKNIGRPVRAYAVNAKSGPAQVKLALPLPDKPSIVVLPFQNMSGDAEQSILPTVSLKRSSRHCHGSDSYSSSRGIRHSPTRGVQST